MRRVDFFKVGGTLDQDAPSYIERPADEHLLRNIEKGDVSLVLAPRQTGKSSLMVHSLKKLEEKGIRSAIVDFQPLGSQREMDAWFRDVIYQIERTLKLDADALDWWENQQRLGPTQRFMVFMEDVVLREIQGRVTIFFDEIDSILRLPFSDDFFTTVRAMANAAASNSVLKRLAFVLLGVATASELIQDRSRTPFNIGKEIELTDFDPDAVAPFREILGTDAAPLVDRIFYWTAGQPLMVQKLAEQVHELPAPERTVGRLDACVNAAYLDVKIEKDTHLNFIRDFLLDRRHNVRKTLKAYGRVIDGQPVEYDERSPVHARLLLSGAVKAAHGRLVPRNRIYQIVFDGSWIRENIPRDTVRMVAYGSSIALFLLLLWNFVVKPLMFPEFTAILVHPWIVENIYYIESLDNLPDIIPPGVDFRKMTINGNAVSLSSKTGSKNSNQMPILREDLKVGVNRFLIRFYGKLWQKNFEEHIIIVYYPRDRWKPLALLDMVEVPAGCFDMGCGDWTDACNDDEKPVHRVCLSAFRIGRYEVTQAAWENLMGYNPSYHNEGGRFPVYNVSWEDVQEFIRRLNALAGGGYGLPSEAQWEYAARSGGKPEKYAGSNDLNAVAWYYANSDRKPHVVGQKDPNGLGIYDMSGNVDEWCRDWYGDYSEGPIKNPVGPRLGSKRVLRGGSWDGDAFYCRSTNRDGSDPIYRDDSFGFRLVYLPDQPDEPSQQAGR